MLCERFGETRLASEDMTVPYMASMRLPTALQGDKSRVHGEKLHKILMYEYKISTFIDPGSSDDMLLRISANIYNTKEDYYRLADALTDLINNPSKLTAVTIDYSLHC